jgi:preprotein translocase subunit YajC
MSMTATLRFVKEDLKVGDRVRYSGGLVGTITEIAMHGSNGHVYAVIDGKHWRYFGEIELEEAA